MATQDPLFAAVQEAVEMVVKRGIEVKPMGDGFFIRVASRETAEAMDASPVAPAGRTW